MLFRKSRIVPKAWQWDYFKPAEVLGPEHFKLYMKKGILAIDPEFMSMISRFRGFLSVPLTMNTVNITGRGTRTWQEHLAIYKKLGVKERKVPKSSLHLFGKAGDVHSAEMPPEEIAREAIRFGFTGVGLYDWGVHLDIRTLHRKGQDTWDNRSKR